MVKTRSELVMKIKTSSETARSLGERGITSGPEFTRFVEDLMDLNIELMQTIVQQDKLLAAKLA